MKKLLTTVLLGITLSSNFIISMEYESQTIAPTRENIRKYMVLSQEDRNSPEAQAKLLTSWEKVSFSDYTIEDLLRVDWGNLNYLTQELEKDEERCKLELEDRQSRFIPGNGKEVMFSGDLYKAIMDTRRSKTFQKDGHLFQLCPRADKNISTSVLTTFSMCAINNKPNESPGWSCHFGTEEDPCIAFEIICIGGLKEWQSLAHYEYDHLYGNY